MPVGLNGQPVLSGWEDPRLVTITVPGTTTRLVVHRGWTQRVAAYVAWRWHTEVELLIKSECYGFDYRPARAGGGAWSSHSTGYAWDLNSGHAGAQLWGASRLKATDQQLRAMARIKEDTGLLWGGPASFGGDYHQPRYWDPMHWDLPKGLEDPEGWLKSMCIRLKIGADGRPTTTPPTPTKPTKPTPPAAKPAVSLRAIQQRNSKDVLIVQQALNKVTGSTLATDGTWGPWTQKVYDAFRRDFLNLAGSAATGSVGRASLQALADRAGFTVND